jgi:hypothetical protein
MKNEIGQYIEGGEPARMFGDNVIVFSEMQVRAIVLRVLQSAQPTGCTCREKNGAPGGKVVHDKNCPNAPSG